MAQLDYDEFDAVLHHIFKQTQGEAWFKPVEESISTGVCLRVEPGVFRVFPYENVFLEPFENAIRILNPEVAVKIRSAAVHAALSKVAPNQTAFYVDNKNRIQILETMDDLATAEKEQCAAFVRDERVLIVWSDAVDGIIPSVLDLEARLVKLVWQQRPGSGILPTAVRASVMTGSSSFKEKSSPNAEPAASKEFKSAEPSEKDVEAGEKPTPRPTRLFAPIYIGLATALAVFFIASGVNILLEEFTQDGNYLRFLLLVTAPLIFCISLFFCVQLINTLSFVIGPISQYHQNSKYYSAIAPKNVKLERLPHITIQMPVYKESLSATIAPSIESIKKAMLTYARKGGTSAIFVCDDGLQLLDETSREERIAFYAHQGIGWVARPPHSNERGGFKRAGRFKKASNMNFGLALSWRMEEILLQLRQNEEGTRTPGARSRLAMGLAADEEEDEEKALRMAVEETSGAAWAAGGKALRIGEIILIVDSDTQVPEDCFYDAACELHQCPEVAIIQHESEVMQVAHHYFENGVAYFTRRINHCISVACANGEVAPFVGHNAFLRWSALQEVAFVDPADNKKKVWSESNVSEDFHLSLALQLKGYVIRWATYSNGGFREGVSLTCDDELNRWQKYAYGCSELMFNPFYQWIYKGPVTKQLHHFVWSPVPLHYKISMMSYMFSYYGIAAALPLALLNYVLLGFSFQVSGFYMHGFEIWLACTVVFLAAGNVGMSVLEYRLNQKGLIKAFLINIKWIPFFFFFFGGLSLHISGAFLAHLFSINITWGATKKEVEFSNFFMEVPKIIKRFWLSFLICICLIAGMIILSTPIIPPAWQVAGSAWAVIFPLAIQTGCHVLYPLVLNPFLLRFQY